MSPNEFKVLLTIATLIGVILILLVVTPGHQDDGRSWRGGSRDPFYRVLYSPDGTFRRQSNGILVGIMIAFNVLVWICL